MPERKLLLVRLQATKLLQLPKIYFTIDLPWRNILSKNLFLSNLWLPKQKQSPRTVLWKRSFQKFYKIHGKALVPGSLFWYSFRYGDFNLIKIEILSLVFPCEFCNIFKNIFFIEHLSWLPLLELILHHIKSCQCFSLLISVEFQSK